MKATTFPLALLLVALIHTSLIAQTLAYEACNICSEGIDDGFEPVDRDAIFFEGLTCGTAHEKGLAGELSPNQCTAGEMSPADISAACGGCKVFTPTESCFRSTEILMGAVYNDRFELGEMNITMHEHEYIGKDGTIPNEIQSLVWSYNDMFESACVTADGMYAEELTWEAKCNFSGSEAMTAYVIGQPICYAKNCAAIIESDEDLPKKFLKEFMLNADETCTVALNDGLAKTCLESTVVIMEAVDSSYNDKDATWQAVTGVERTITDDFTTNQAYNKIYESACDTAGGTYKELTYEAKCNNKQDGWEFALEITLYVNGQPRCYAKSCAAAIESDEDLPNRLLQQFTLKPTAERANEMHESTSTWTCGGALIDGPTNTNIGTTGCAMATNLLNTQTESLVRAITIAKKPAVSDIKFLFLIPTNGKKVQYNGDESTTLENECGKASGLFMENNFKMTCTTGEGSGGSEAAFEVTDFPSCLASLCNTDQAVIDGAIVTQFRDEMLDSDNLDNSQDWTCVRSGAVMAASIRVSVGTVLALWWYLI